MDVQPTSNGLRAALAERPRPRVLVPTMGALHEGHLALMDEARRLAGEDGSVVATIFVNPTQFGPDEDLASYPRPLEEDLAKCEARGVDVVFTPSPQEIYFEDHSMSVTEDSLSKGLCGTARPGHFDGVCLVVLKLFHIADPDLAVFGKKDYQQLAIIRRMVRDLNLEVGIHGVDTVREDDGLAMSSRNAYLSEEERTQAPGIRATLLDLGEAACRGGATGEGLLGRFREQIAERVPLGRIDYVEVVDRDTLEPIRGEVDGPALVACAVHLGKARLIDNLEIGP